MIDNHLLAGLVAAIPISLLCLGYVAVRRDEVVQLLADGDASDSLPSGAATVLAFTVAAVAGPVLGMAAAVVHGWLPSEAAYVALAVALATLMSVMAVATRTPLMIEKIILNVAVLIALGFVAPRLMAG